MTGTPTTPDPRYRRAVATLDRIDEAIVRLLAVAESLRHPHDGDPHAPR